MKQQQVYVASDNLQFGRPPPLQQPLLKPMDILLQQARQTDSISGSLYNSSPIRAQQQPQQQQTQMVVHETFSISQLERQMMFLNEPSLQGQPARAHDRIRQLWLIHHQQMINMHNERPQQSTINRKDESVPKRPDSIDEIGGQPGFSAPGQRPKDFDRFQTSVNRQLDELHKAHKDLRKRFKEAGSDVEKDIRRIENLTDSLQQIFNDFVACFNSFVQREERLETLHTQAIKKSKELSTKMQLEVMAQSSQRSQLLTIVDDLTIQLRETKASQVPKNALKSEQAAHEHTQMLLDQKIKQIESMERDITKLGNSLQQFGQTGEVLKGQKGALESEIRRLNGLIQGQNADIDDLILRKSQLEHEVSRLKSQIELTQSSKDKIILKLKQEMRIQAQQSAINATTLNNTTSFIAAGVNTSQPGAANKQNQQFQNLMQVRQSQQFNTSGQRSPNLPQ